ncbi:MAG: site-specific recombinase XerD, partial [Candidatus Marinamargulisbacteria bacterium]
TYEIRVLGKGKQERIALFNDPARQWIVRYIQEIRPIWEQNNSKNAIFLNQRGHRLTSRSVQRMIQKLGQQSALQHAITPHTFRHSFATDLFSGGADLRSVQELLGHKRISTTQIYTHLDVENLKDVVNRAHPRSKRTFGNN